MLFWLLETFISPILDILFFLAEIGPSGVAGCGAYQGYPTLRNWDISGNSYIKESIRSSINNKVNQFKFTRHFYSFSTQNYHQIQTFPNQNKFKLFESHEFFFFCASVSVSRFYVPPSFFQDSWFRPLLQ